MKIRIIRKPKTLLPFFLLAIFMHWLLAFQYRIQYVPAEGCSVRRSTLDFTDYSTKTSEWQSYMAKLNITIDRTLRRGVVYTTYSKVLNQTILSILALKKVGCKLPIEAWYYGNDLSEFEIGVLENLNVTVHDLKKEMHGDVKYEVKHAFFDDRMYEVKGGALLYTKLTQVLYLDSDNIPLVNPTHLFNNQHFIETGAVFWPDYWKTSEYNPIWGVLNINCTTEYEQESGQMLVDKTRPGVLRGLHLAFYMQSQKQFYFSILLGDKDTFRFGFRALGVEYYMVNTHVGTVASRDLLGYCGHSILQYEPMDYLGHTPRPLFLHVNTLKGTSRNNHDAFDVISRYEFQVAPLSKTHYRPYVGSHLGLMLKGHGCTIMDNVLGNRVIYEDFDKVVPGFKHFYKKVENSIQL